MQLERRFDVPNTLGVTAQAEFGCRASSIEEVREAIAFARQRDLQYLPMGEGSNVVPHALVHGLVCVLGLTGIELRTEDEHSVHVSVCAGENWHTFVMTCLHHGWYGLENLALIPGSVGAAPVQNIGAYGVEIAAFIDSVEVLDRAGTPQILSVEACRFAYRDSVFKQSPGYTILRVNLRLRKQPAPVTDYPALAQELERHGVTGQPTPAQLAAAVIAIRSAKLPDPVADPNVGSFFKNPVISRAHAEQLAQRIDGLQRFDVYAGKEDEGVKLSAAQLIDLAGWKQRPAVHVACWPLQPLVLFNTGGASGREVLDYAAAIQADVYQRFGVQLVLEPSVLS